MNPDAWRPGHYNTLGSLGRTILPPCVGRDLLQVVALACYFDESFDEQIHVIGGYLAPVQVWDQMFAPAWNEVLNSAPHKISEFKASDCRNGRGEFSAPWTKAQRLELTIKLVSVLLSMPIYAGVSSAFFWSGKADSDSPDVKKDRYLLEKRGYGVSLAICLADAFWLGGQISDTDSIQPVIDKRKKFFRRAVMNFEFIRSKLAPELASKIKFPIEGDSKSLAPLQAADLIAYETFKEVVGRCDNIKPSRALERLVSGRTGYHSRCIAMPSLLQYNRMLAIDKRPKPTEYTLFRSGAPLRAPGHWGVATSPAPRPHPSPRT